MLAMVLIFPNVSRSGFRPRSVSVTVWVQSNLHTDVRCGAVTRLTGCVRELDHPALPRAPSRLSVLPRVGGDLRCGVLIFWTWVFVRTLTLGPEWGASPFREDAYGDTTLGRSDARRGSGLGIFLFWILWTGE